MKKTILTWHSVDNIPTDTSKEYLVKTDCGFMVCSYCDSLFSSIHDFFDELVECGYMRKTQNRIAGKFQNVDHEVSFQPFTENPYTVNPSTVNPTQQSTDIKKYGSNKESNTDISKADDHLFCISEVMDRFPMCSDAIHKLTSLGEYGYKFHTGKLSISEWEDCELAMKSVDEFDMEYFTWWAKERYKSFSKIPSLPNMLADVLDTPFEEFYNSTFMQEWE